MAEAVGVTTTSVLPTNLSDQMQMLILEVRVMQMMLKEGLGITDEPSQLRQLLAKSTEIVVS